MADEQRITEEQKVAFLDDVEAVCRKHGISISHEDGHGSFTVIPFDHVEMVWLKNAYIERRK